MTDHPTHAGRRPASARLAPLALCLAAGIAAGAAWAAQAVVTQRDKAFSAQRVELRAGDALLIHNEDTRAHNIQVNHPQLTYNSGLQEPGEDARVAFDRPGDYLVFCGIHPKMKLRVAVR
jgi:cytochrome c peroxidase